MTTESMFGPVKTEIYMYKELIRKRSLRDDDIGT